MNRDRQGPERRMSVRTTPINHPRTLPIPKETPYLLVIETPSIASCRFARQRLIRRQVESFSRLSGMVPFGFPTFCFTQFSRNVCRLLSKRQQPSMYVGLQHQSRLEGGNCSVSFEISKDYAISKVNNEGRISQSESQCMLETFPAHLEPSTLSPNSLAPKWISEMPNNILLYASG